MYSFYVILYFSVLSLPQSFVIERQLVFELLMYKYISAVCETLKYYYSSIIIQVSESQFGIIAGQSRSAWFPLPAIVSSHRPPPMFIWQTPDLECLSERGRTQVVTGPISFPRAAFVHHLVRRVQFTRCVSIVGMSPDHCHSNCRRLLVPFQALIRRFFRVWFVGLNVTLSWSWVCTLFLGNT